MLLPLTKAHHATVTFSGKRGAKWLAINFVTSIAKLHINLIGPKSFTKDNIDLFGEEE
jgi:hypothetical protein